MTHPLRRSLLATAILLSLLIVATVTAPPCLSQDLTPERLLREGKYVEAIRSLDQRWRAAGKLSPGQLRLYLDAYYQHGKQLAKKGDSDNARACFLRIISLDPRHADSHFHFGIIEKRAKNYQKALQYLRSAISLRSQHSPEANTAIIEIANESLTAAAKAIAGGQVQTARSYLTFVTSNFAGEEKNKALELTTYGLIPLERAAAEYTKATRLLTARGKPQAVTILRGIPKDYSGTFFAQRANQLLQQLGEKIIAVRTSTGLELPPSWRRRQTVHFDVYYEKEIFFNRIVPQAEKVLPQVFASFGYAKPNWKKKCKIYLFSSLKDWRKFLEANKESLRGWYNAFGIPHAMEVYLYQEKDTSYMVKQTVPHELTHIVHFGIVGDFRYTPMWFIEGLAILHEEGERKELRRNVRSLRRTGNYISLKELVSLRGYPAETEKVGMFYLESAALTDLLLRNFGPKKVREMAIAYRQPVPLAAVLKNVLGITMDDLEKLWKRYVE